MVCTFALSAHLGLAWAPGGNDAGGCGEGVLFFKILLSKINPVSEPLLLLCVTSER